MPLKLPVNASVSSALVPLTRRTDETDNPEVAGLKLNCPGDKDETYDVPTRSTVSRAPLSVRSASVAGSVEAMLAPIASVVAVSSSDGGPSGARRLVAITLTV